MVIDKSCNQQRLAHVKKYEQPRTWLCTKLSVIFSCPKSSTGSDQRMSHISPCVGGSRNRSIWIQKLDPRLCGQSWTYIANIFKGVKFWGKATVNAKELLVHDRCQRQRAERLHTCVVDAVRVFVFTWRNGQLIRRTSWNEVGRTFKFEGEIVS